MSQATKLQISQINRTGGTQPRSRLDEDAVREYAALIKDGYAFPPIDVVYDGTTYWPWNGFHRIAAHELCEFTEIVASVTNGTLEDAQWLSFSANKDNGLRRGNGDVKNSLLRIFAHPSWQKKSQREIAAHVGCSRGFVYEVLEGYRDATKCDGPRAGPEPANKGVKKSATAAPVEQPARARADDGEDDAADEGTTPPGSGQAPGDFYSFVPAGSFWRAKNETLADAFHFEQANDAVGQADEDWPLRPFLLRIGANLLSSELLAVEASSRREFEAQAHLHVSPNVLSATTDDVDWWALMQHHGAPTRVLDWTLSPFVAAYFAVRDHPKTNGTVWWVNSQALNVRAMRRLNAPGRKLSAGCIWRSQTRQHCSHSRANCAASA